MAIDISGIYIFMPIFSFLFVFIIVLAILKGSKILGEVPFANVLVSFIMAIIFISFSSLNLYVQTLIPWVAVLIVCVFFIMMVYGFASGKLDEIFKNKGFAWGMVGVLVVIFLIAAIRVFNPIFHPDLIITSGEGTSLIEQISYAYEGRIFGTVLLLIISAVVAMIITKK